MAPHSAHHSHFGISLLWMFLKLSFYGLADGRAHCDILQQKPLQCCVTKRGFYGNEFYDRFRGLSSQYYRTRRINARQKAPTRFDIGPKLHTHKLRAEAWCIVVCTASHQLASVGMYKVKCVEMRHPHTQTHNSLRYARRHSHSSLVRRTACSHTHMCDVMYSRELIPCIMRMSHRIYSNDFTFLMPNA